jgi:hypothetical protein
MTSGAKAAEARLGFRVLAGITGVLILTTALPLSVLVAVRSDPSMWLVAFPSLVAGLGLATVAFTGHWLRLKRTHDQNSS